MTWVRLLRSRVMNGLLAGVFTLSLGMPEVFAAAGNYNLRNAATANVPLQTAQMGLEQFEQTLREGLETYLSQQGHSREDIQSKIDDIARPLSDQVIQEGRGVVTITRESISANPYALVRYWEYLVRRAAYLSDQENREVTIAEAAQREDGIRVRFDGPLIDGDWNLPAVLNAYNDTYPFMALRLEWFREGALEDILTQAVSQPIEPHILDQLREDARKLGQRFLRLFDRIVRKRAAAPAVADPREGLVTVSREALLSEVAPQLFANLDAYGLSVKDVKIKRLDGEANPAQDLGSAEAQAAISVSAAQALASANYAGMADAWGYLTSAQKSEFGKIADGAAVVIGLEALERMAGILDITIVIAGNEGDIRDDSASMRVGQVINSKGTRGTYLYFGDSIEVTNGIKSGSEGSSSMMALTPASISGMHDGYLTSVFMDWPEGVAPVDFDPVAAGSGNLRQELQKIVDAHPDYGSIADLAAEYSIVSLDRPKHDVLFQEAERLGFEVQTELDGDALPGIRAINGIRDANGKKALVITTSGANEAYMVQIAAATQNKGLAVSKVVSRKALKKVDKADYDTGQGSLATANDFAADETDVQDMNEALATVPSITVPELEQGATLTRQGLAELLRDQEEGAVLAVASITGARKIDVGALQALVQPVRFNEVAGEAVVTGFYVSPQGELIFYEATFESDDLLDSRWQLAVNAVKKSQERGAENVITLPAIQNFITEQNAYQQALGTDRADETEAGYRGYLNNVLGQADSGAAIADLEHGVMAEILGRPAIALENGNTVSLVESSEAVAEAAAVEPRQGTVLAGYESVLTNSEAFKGEGLTVTEFAGLIAPQRDGDVQNFAQNELNALWRLGLLNRTRAPGTGAYTYTLTPWLAAAIETNREKLLQDLGELIAAQPARGPDRIDRARLGPNDAVQSAALQQALFNRQFLQVLAEHPALEEFLVDERFGFSESFKKLETRLDRTFTTGERLEILNTVKTVREMLPQGNNLTEVDLIEAIQKTNVGHRYREMLQDEVEAVPPTVVFNAPDLDDYFAKARLVAVTVDTDFVAVNVIASPFQKLFNILAKGGFRLYRAGEGNLRERTLIDKLRGIVGLKGGDPIMEEGFRLGYAMKRKNLLWSWMTGGKTASVIREGSDLSDVDVTRRLVASSISAEIGTHHYIFGPDMNTDTLMATLVDVANKAQESLGMIQEQGRRTILATTSRTPAEGSYSHTEWMVTSISTVESFLRPLENAAYRAAKGIADDDSPITIAIQGYGDVGSGIVGYLAELKAAVAEGEIEGERAAIINRLQVIGISDITGSLINRNGLAESELLRLREMGLLQAALKKIEIADKTLTESEAQAIVNRYVAQGIIAERPSGNLVTYLEDLASNYKGVVGDYAAAADGTQEIEGIENGTAVLGIGADIVIPAAISNVFESKEQIAAMADVGTKIMVEAANISIVPDQGLEAHFKAVGIDYYPGPVVNGGGVHTSSHEVQDVQMRGEDTVRTEIESGEAKEKIQQSVKDTVRLFMGKVVEVYLAEGQARSFDVIADELLDKIEARLVYLEANEEKAVEAVAQKLVAEGLPIRMARLVTMTDQARADVLGFEGPMTQIFKDRAFTELETRLVEQPVESVQVQWAQTLQDAAQGQTALGYTGSGTLNGGLAQFRAMASANPGSFTTTANDFTRNSYETERRPGGVPETVQTMTTERNELNGLEALGLLEHTVGERGVFHYGYARWLQLLQEHDSEAADDFLDAVGSLEARAIPNMNDPRAARAREAVKQAAEEKGLITALQAEAAGSNDAAERARAVLAAMPEYFEVPPVVLVVAVPDTALGFSGAGRLFEEFTAAAIEGREPNPVEPVPDDDFFEEVLGLPQNSFHDLATAVSAAARSA